MNDPGDRKLGQHDHQLFQVGPFHVNIWDGNGTFEALELTVSGCDKGVLFWKTFEYGEISLPEVKKIVGEWAGPIIALWLAEAKLLVAGCQYVHHPLETDKRYTYHNIYATKMRERKANGS